MMQSMWSKLNKVDLGNAVAMDYLGFEYANFGLTAYTEPEGKPFETNKIRLNRGKQFRSRWVN